MTMTSSGSFSQTMESSLLSHRGHYTTVWGEQSRVSGPWVDACVLLCAATTFLDLLLLVTGGPQALRHLGAVWKRDLHKWMTLWLKWPDCLSQSSRGWFAWSEGRDSPYLITPPPTSSCTSVAMTKCRDKSLVMSLSFPWLVRVLAISAVLQKGMTAMWEQTPGCPVTALYLPDDRKEKLAAKVTLEGLFSMAYVTGNTLVAVMMQNI